MTRVEFTRLLFRLCAFGLLLDPPYPGFWPVPHWSNLAGQEVSILRFSVMMAALGLILLVLIRPLLTALLSRLIKTPEPESGAESGSSRIREAVLALIGAVLFQSCWIGIWMVGSWAELWVVRPVHRYLTFPGNPGFSIDLWYPAAYTWTALLLVWAGRTGRRDLAATTSAAQLSLSEVARVLWSLASIYLILQFLPHLSHIIDESLWGYNVSFWPTVLHQYALMLIAGVFLLGVAGNCSPILVGTNEQDPLREVKLWAAGCGLILCFKNSVQFATYSMTLMQIFRQDGRYSRNAAFFVSLMALPLVRVTLGVCFAFVLPYWGRKKMKLAEPPDELSPGR